MKKILLLFFTLMAVGFSNQSMAQSNTCIDKINLQIKELRILNIGGGTNQLKSEESKSNEAVDFVTDSNIGFTWLNFTSIVGEEGKTNKITAQLEKPLPPFEKIKIITAVYVGNGNGTFGLPSSEVILTTEPQDIITGIGSCWTGVGNNGFKIMYKSNDVSSFSVIYKIIEE